MCGICAVATIGSSEDGIHAANNIVANLMHRGPDGANVETVECCGSSVTLGHTRLAVVGGADAVQPLHRAIDESTFHLVVNGEIYNYRELRQKLVIDGDCAIDDFDTDGDSEVLLACIVHRGLEWALDNIRGMYAFILVTVVREKIESITLCRDVFGIKPLSYALSSQQKIFVSSEMGSLSDSVDATALVDVLPSSYVTVECCSNGKSPQWMMNETMYRITTPAPTSTAFDSANLIRSKLIEAVSIRIPSNIRWAVLLSGGLDSSLIAAIAADAVYPEPLFAFTIAFDDENSMDQSTADTDVYYARCVADSRPNIIHEEVIFSWQDGLDALPRVVKIVETTDVAVVRASVPLYLLSQHIASKQFKVLLCGEGADEVFAGYRLFEQYNPSSIDDCVNFGNELDRRLFNIDTSELQRVDRCTMAHGLEARVPFLDCNFVEEVLRIDHRQKMAHPSLGKIQKYILRNAFDGFLPDSVLYREKTQFADGIGTSWVTNLQSYATREFHQSGMMQEDFETALYRKHLHSNLNQELRLLYSNFIEARKSRRRKNAHVGKVQPGSSQPTRWHKIQHDEVLQKMNLTLEDAHTFLQNVLGWQEDDIETLTNDLSSLNKLIVSMLSRVPFHNLTLLARERRPPTPNEIKEDMMTGQGGPCSVVNSFFAVLLDVLGFGPHIYLLSCKINGRDGCHVGILLQMRGLRYFVDVANAKPYTQAIQLGDSTIKSSLGGTFHWSLEYSSESKMTRLLHHTDGLHDHPQVAVEFHPSISVKYSSFREMIRKSRSDKTFGPFLTGLRFCLYPDEASQILAVRDACIYNGALSDRLCALSRGDLIAIANKDAFAHIDRFSGLVQKAINVLDAEHPNWFDVACAALKIKGICLDHRVRT